MTADEHGQPLRRVSPADSGRPPRGGAVDVDQGDELPPMRGVQPVVGRRGRALRSVFATLRAGRVAAGAAERRQLASVALGHPVPSFRELDEDDAVALARLLPRLVVTADSGPAAVTAALAAAGLDTPAARREAAQEALGHPVSAWEDMTRTEVVTLLALSAQRLRDARQAGRGR